MSVYPTPSQQEAELKILRKEIEYARKKAESYRKRAAAQDAIADAKVKKAAELGTGVLPLMGDGEHGGIDHQTYGIKECRIEDL